MVVEEVVLAIIEEILVGGAGLVAKRDFGCRESGGGGAENLQDI